MTTILVTPLLDTATGTAPATAMILARQTFKSIVDGQRVTLPQTIVFTFRKGAAPVVELKAPRPGDAWKLNLQGPDGADIVRYVTWNPAASYIAWADLIDVDPATLNPVPIGDDLKAWQAVQRALEDFARTPGLPGKDGVDGKDGADGKDGKDGADGLPGKDGEDGTDGLPGKAGEDGTDGLPGKDGTDGLPGKDGTNGTDGLPGKDGTNGTNGTNGKDGTNGTNGTNGKDGARGPAGVTSVSATGLAAGAAPTASLTDGALALGIPQGGKGDKGDKGDKGETGATGTASIVQTTSNTSVQNSQALPANVVFTVPSSNGFIVGGPITAVNAGQNYIAGTVTALTATTITMRATSAGGNGGTFNSWTLLQGVSGPQGPKGTDGTTPDLSPYFRTRGTISANDNLNYIKTPGSYRVLNSFTDAQYGRSNVYQFGEFRVFASADGGPVITQMYIPDGAGYYLMRQAWGGDFGSSSNWFRYNGTAV